MPSAMRTPAAQYVRMSTEEQQYSIVNQQAAIATYARIHGFQVVRTYADTGRSGIEITNRRGLRNLLHDAISGKANYQAILVYDVSRWGRFQDIDEAAHYEFICKDAGIPVHYCAEQFANDSTTPSSIMKALKRSMAGEFSRELGVKVYDGQRRLSLLGFKGGGAAAFGLTRMLISADGKRRRKLKPGEWKSVNTDRIILVPGPRKEVRCVRQMFALAVKHQRTPGEIAQMLNRKLGKRVTGRRWTAQSVWRMLRNPEYMGCSTWGRTATRLDVGVKQVPRTDWVMKPAAYAAIIDENTFQMAQQLIEARKNYPARPDAVLIEKLKLLLARKGRLNETIIRYARGVFNPRTYWKHFGSLLRAYELIGYSPIPRIVKSMKHALRMHNMRKRLLDDLREFFPDNVRITRISGVMRPVIEIDRTIRVSVYLCRSFLTLGGRRRWMFRIRPSERGNIALVCTADSEVHKILKYYLLPPVGNTVRTYKQLHKSDPWLTRGRKLNRLTDFYTAVRGCSQEQCRISIRIATRPSPNRYRRQMQ